jgi:iron(III) transport system permease protein
MPRGRGGTALIVLLGIGVAAPLAAVLIRAVTGYNGQPSALPELVNPRNLETLGNTIVLGVLVVIIATVMAAPLAFAMSWTRMREHQWIEVVLMIPFMTPPYVMSLAWLDFVRVNGLAEQVFGPVGVVLRNTIESPFGMAFVMASEVFTFLYLILRNHLDSIPASMDEAAQTSGASAEQRFRMILAPLSTTAFSLGALIVFIRAAGEFGTPVTLGNKIGFRVLVSEIYSSVTIDPLDFPTAAALSSVLLALGITVWGLQQWISRKPTPFGGRAARRATVNLPPLARAGAWGWLALVVLLSVVVPYVAILLGSMTILRSQPLSLENLTFDYFAIVMQPGAGLTPLLNSATLALISATIATALGVASALAIARLKRLWSGRVIDLLSVASDTVPAIVLAIGFIFLWNSPWLPVTPYNTSAMVVIGYVVVLLPMVVQNVKNSRDAIDERLLEAATISGAGTLYTLRRIMLPLLMPGIITGWLLGFLLALREVVFSSLVRPASLDLLSPWIMNEFDQGHRAEAMAMTVIGVLGSVVVLVIVDTFRRKRQAASLA